MDEMERKMSVAVDEIQMMPCSLVFFAGSGSREGLILEIEGLLNEVVARDLGSNNFVSSGLSRRSVGKYEIKQLVGTVTEREI